MYETTVVAGPIGMEVLEDNERGRIGFQPKSGWWMVQNRKRKMI
jgi:hypothetical protein